MTVTATAPPEVPSVMRVRRVVRESEDTFTLHLDGDLRPGAPGQFAILGPLAGGEVAVSYSGDAGAGHESVHTLRSVGSVTRALVAVRKGDVVLARGPFGTGWPVPTTDSRDVLVVAGGLGIAPLRALVLRVLRERARFGRVIVVYGARTPADVLFAGELAAWRARGDVEVVVTVDRAGPEWKGPVGVVTGPLAALPLDPERTVAFVCGPEVMMRFVGRELARRGVPDDAVWIALERNMQCGVGLCGHCQLGPVFVCKDGPVLSLARAWPLMRAKGW